MEEKSVYKTIRDSMYNDFKDTIWSIITTQCDDTLFLFNNNTEIGHTDCKFEYLEDCITILAEVTKSDLNVEPDDLSDSIAINKVALFAPDEPNGFGRRLVYEYTTNDIFVSNYASLKFVIDICKKED